MRYPLDGGWDKISTEGSALDEPKSFRLPVVRGQTFIGSNVALGNTRFENCVFETCDITYHGSPAETSSCYFENVRWILEGAAGTIVTVMQ